MQFGSIVALCMADKNDFIYMYSKVPAWVLLPYLPNLYMGIYKTRGYHSFMDIHLKYLLISFTSTTLHCICASQSLVSSILFRFVDGEDYMAAVGDAISKAKKEIFITDWQ